MPETRKKFQALTNLSVPMPRMPGQPDDKRTFMVEPGEIVELTEEQARNFMRLRVPAIRPAAQSGDPLPRIAPAQLSGPLRKGLVNPPGDFTGARADPPGASHIQVVSNVPEVSDPAPGSENVMSAGPMDIKPGTGVTG
jgi:hypothetical protein